MASEITQHAGLSFLPKPQDLIGTYRRFGEFGPVYQIIGVGPLLDDGDVLLTLHIPGPTELEEEFERRYSRVILDPEES